MGTGASSPYPFGVLRARMTSPAATVVHAAVGLTNRDLDTAMEVPAKIRLEAVTPLLYFSRRSACTERGTGANSFSGSFVSTRELGPVVWPRAWGGIDFGESRIIDSRRQLGKI